MIRQAGIADLVLLEDCAREFYASSKFLGNFDVKVFAKVWRQLFNSGNGVIFIDEQPGGIAGAIGGIIRRDIYSANEEDLIAEEFFWFVRSTARGEGVALYRAFAALARERGCKGIQMVHLLDLMPDKVSKFYLREGFVPIETRYAKEF